MPFTIYIYIYIEPSGEAAQCWICTKNITVGVRIQSTKSYPMDIDYSVLNALDNRVILKCKITVR